MKYLTLLFCFLAITCLSQTMPVTTALVTITNASKITNAQSTFSVNGTTRTWTNQTGFSPSTSIAFTNDGFQATTNLTQAYQRYAAIGSSGAPVACRTNATNIVKFISAEGDMLTISFTPGYCSVTYSTNYFTNATPYRIPFTSEPNQTRSNMISGDVDNLNKYATNALLETAEVMSNFVGLTAVQTFGNKTITNSTLKGVTITNASLQSNYIQAILSQTNGILFLANLGATVALLGVNPADGSPGLYNVGLTPFDALTAADFQAVPMNWFSVSKYFPRLNNLGGNNTNVFINSNTFQGVVILQKGMQSTGGMAFNLTATNLIAAAQKLQATNLDAGGAGTITLTNVLSSVQNQTVTNQNVLQGTLTNVTLAVANQTVTNQNVLQSTMTNAAGAFSGLTTTNLQALSGYLSNVNWINVYGTNTFLTGSNRANAIFFTRYDYSSLGNSNNIAVAAGTNQNIRFTQGSLSAPANICGIVGAASVGGADGQTIVFRNSSGYTLTFSAGTIDPSPQNRFNDPSQAGVDVAVVSGGNMCVKYNSATLRWEPEWIYPAVAKSTNATQFDTTSTVASPPTPSIGFALQYQNGSTVWISPDTGWWPVIDEEFLGDTVTSAQISLFREAWYRAATGASNPPQQPTPYEDGALGILPFWTTNFNTGMYLTIGGQSTAAGMIACTNLDLFCVSRIRIGQTNSGSDLSSLSGGLGNISSATSDPTDGIFFRTSTNANNNVELITSRASSRTVTLSTGYLTQWDGTGNSFTNIALYLDSTGTNVYMYMGKTMTNLTVVATNQANIPNTVLVSPFICNRRIAASAGTANRTNYWDNYRLWARRH